MQANQIDRRKQLSFDRELCFYSDKFNELIKRSELVKLSDEKLSLLLSEATNLFASLGGVIQDINKRIESGRDDIEERWSRRLRTKALVVKHFIDSIKKEQKDRKFTVRDRNFRLLVELRLGRAETGRLLARAQEMTEEEWAGLTGSRPGYFDPSTKD
jgi:hypothetical protein